jgi:3-methyladenine DNA glycosylase AlkC
MAEKLKDMYMTPASVKAMAAVIKRVYPEFDKKRFTGLVLDERFEGMELKARMRHVTECLYQVLPKSYKKALSILKKSALEVKGFESMCLPDYVELYGLEDWASSLPAMAVFTKYSSSEFAIRPFIIREPRRAMAYMKKLAEDKDPRVRRFASEGCRPRLPWAMVLPVFKKDPGLIFPVLEKLKNDDSEFVRRSVANNLNDISKDHPELMLNLCEKWQGQSDDIDWVVKHACRTLLKAGNSRAMQLFGFGSPAKITVKNLVLNRSTIKIGDRVQLSWRLKVATGEKCKVRQEYAVTFQKAHGRVSQKVFKISEKTFQPGEYELTKKHSFEDMSTRKHYPGVHTIAIIVNGEEKANTGVKLIK